MSSGGLLAEHIGGRAFRWTVFVVYGRGAASRCRSDISDTPALTIFLCKDHGLPTLSGTFQYINTFSNLLHHDAPHPRSCGHGPSGARTALRLQFLQWTKQSEVFPSTLLRMYLTEVPTMARTFTSDRHVHPVQCYTHLHVFQEPSLHHHRTTL